MTRIQESVEIAAAPMVVFGFCHDPKRRAEWDERVVGVEMITPAPIRKGTLIRFDAGSRGKFLFSWEAEYTAHQTPSGSTLKVLDAAPSSPFGTGTETWQFNKIGNGTRFTLIWEYQPRNFFVRVGDALWRRAGTRRAIQRSLKKLKKIIEAE